MTSEFAPDTADGWAVLHQFFDVDRRGLRQLPPGEREEVLAELRSYLLERERMRPEGQSACFHILGHKGNFVVLHFRRTFDMCAQEELTLQGLRVSEYLSLRHSFVSVVEMGMYHTTKKLLENLDAKGLKLHSPEWTKEYETSIEHHKSNLDERRFTEIPLRPYFCFYPMSKKRDGHQNWYRQSIDRRAELMMEHGMTGRRYGGKITQIISGSIGFDDWEWGVDLFADDPLNIKKLIYEMRFDEVTALYGEFGPFYFGVRLPGAEVATYFSGQLPEFPHHSPVSDAS